MYFEVWGKYVFMKHVYISIYARLVDLYLAFGKPSLLNNVWWDDLLVGMCTQQFELPRLNFIALPRDLGQALA